MSNNKRKGIAYTKASPKLVERVKDVVAEGAKRRYSVSKVYAVYNEVFELNEKPESCSSCLINRVNLLSGWLGGYNDYTANAKKIMPDAFAALPDVVHLTNAETGEVTAFQMKGGALKDIDGKTAPSGVYIDEKSGKNYEVGKAGKYSEIVGTPKPKEDLT